MDNQSNNHNENPAIKEKPKVATFVLSHIGIFHTLFIISFVIAFIVGHLSLQLNIPEYLLVFLPFVILGILNASIVLIFGEHTKMATFYHFVYLLMFVVMGAQIYANVANTSYSINNQTQIAQNVNQLTKDWKKFQTSMSNFDSSQSSSQANAQSSFHWTFADYEKFTEGSWNDNTETWGYGGTNKNLLNTMSVGTTVIGSGSGNDGTYLMMWESNSGQKVSLEFQEQPNGSYLLDWKAETGLDISNPTSSQVFTWTLANYNALVVGNSLTGAGGTGAPDAGRGQYVPQQDGNGYGVPSSSSQKKVGSNQLWQVTCVYQSATAKVTLVWMGQGDASGGNGHYLLAEKSEIGLQ